MAVTQVELSAEETRRLKEIAARDGKTTDELVHNAVGDLLAREDRLSRMRAARGIWADRDDLPDLRELRAEWDRQLTDRAED